MIIGNFANVVAFIAIGIALREDVKGMYEADLITVASSKLKNIH